MAVDKRLLSFATIDSGSKAGIELLYLRIDGAEGVMSTGDHEHDYSQLEILTAPGSTLHSPAGRQRLRRGDVVILPPQCRHRFTYRPGAAWISLRYHLDTRSVETQTILHEADDPVLRPARRFLSNLGAAGDPQANPAFAAACRSLLLHLHPRPTQDRSDPLVTAVQAAIDQAQGRRLHIPTLAARLAYSRNHLCAAFKQRSGRSLKDSIDRATAEAAARMLRYDDRSIGQIAAALDFPDIYAFSRFFLRITGQRPSDLRKH